MIRVGKRVIMQWKWTLETIVLHANTPIIACCAYRCPYLRFSCVFYRGLTSRLKESATFLLATRHAIIILWLLGVCPPNEDFGKMIRLDEQRADCGVSFDFSIYPSQTKILEALTTLSECVSRGSTFQGREYSIWATNRWKVLPRETHSESVVRASKIFVWRAYNC